MKNLYIFFRNKIKRDKRSSLILLGMILFITVNIAANAVTFSSNTLPGINSINSNDTIIFDFLNAVIAGNYIDIPVSFSSDDTVYAVDFSMKFNENILKYDTIITHKIYLSALAHFSQADRKLRLTSNSLQQIENNKSFLSIRFSIVSSCGQIHSTDFNTINVYLNGDPCSFKITGYIPDGSVAYMAGTVVNTCVPGSFCLPVSASLPVSDVVGYDMVLHYDKTKVHPTGTITKGRALIDSFKVDITSSIDSVNGAVNITENINSHALPCDRFRGIGGLFCVEFAKNTSFQAVDTAVFTISGLQESYISGVQPKVASPGKYITYKDTALHASLKFWNGNGPLKYNSANPSQYLITNIFGNNASCDNKSAVAVHPDTLGNLVYSMTNGPDVNIERDILNTTDVHPVINGADAVLTRQLLVNTFVNPSVYQVIAMDVNEDGVVSAGDAYQISQRSVLSIGEFQQKWNYDNSGNPIQGKGKSKDWLFVNQQLLASPSYSISSTFPADNGTGYSKYRVPQVDSCMVVPVSNATTCPTIGPDSYKGILLGDVNGNFATVGSGGVFKIASSSNKAVLDMSKAKAEGGYF